ncbi:MAG: hypothetical protein AAGD07_14130, partial [Planctomycetota bacterium]
LDAHLRQEAQTDFMTDDVAPSQTETDQVAPYLPDGTLSRSRSYRWGSIVVVATVLLALTLLFPNGGRQSAMAAVRRSLNVAAELTTRKYLLQVEFQTPGGAKRLIYNDLYVHGNDRFALRNPGGLLRRSFWLGQDGSEAWVVPSFGAVLKGDRTIHKRWLRSLNEEYDEKGGPDLRINFLLTQMSCGYELLTLDDEEIAIADNGKVLCQHIRAQRNTSEPPYRPDTIDLWTGLESGLAVQLVAQWELEDDEVGRKTVRLMFQQEEPSLTKDWFKAESHYQGKRPINRLDAAGN